MKKKKKIILLRDNNNFVIGVLALRVYAYATRKMVSCLVLLLLLLFLTIIMRLFESSI